MYCPQFPRECNAAPYTTAQLAQGLKSQVFEQYITTKLRFVENQTKLACEIEVQARIQAEVQRLERMSQFQRSVEEALHEIESILTTKCGRCQQAFVDFEGCLALSCSRCAANFCAWCLTVFDNSQLAHSHVLACNERPSGHNGLYASPDVVHTYHTNRCRTRAQSYLQKFDKEVQAEVLRRVRWNN